MTAIPYPGSRNKNLLTQAISAILISGVLFLVALILWLVGFQIYYAGRIYPGVSIAGVDVSGLKPSAAAARLAQSIAYPQQGKLLLRDGDHSWIASPAHLGYFLDPENSSLAALQIGRQGDPLTRLNTQFRSWMNGVDLPPVMVFDQRIGQSYLQNLSQEINKPVVEASLGLNGVDVVVNSGQIGRTLDIDATLALLSVQLQTLQDGVVSMLVRETPPLILDASKQAEIARQILSQPLTLSITNPSAGDPGPWTFDPQTLAGMLNVELVQDGANAEYRMAVNSETLRQYLANLAPGLARQPVNSRFIFNDDTDQLDVLEPAVIGRSLNVEASVEAVNQKLAQGEHNIPLEFTITNPPVTDDMTGQQLGIIELVHAETSYFRGSSAARIQNITAASSRFHGLLVAPGETFSMAQALGDISLDNGYAEALIIFGDQTIKGVGGGVCQVSTTLFRTVFFAGYPVVERYAHAYRVSYYEQKAGSGVNPNFAGLDATVFVPLVDFKFTNDTPNWLLMETYVEGASLTWKFYSTSEGRSVEWTTTGLTNVTEPEPPLYRENPDLPQGELKQVEWATDGADVSVSRTVSKNGSVYIQDNFYTHFVPWREVHEYGPGTPGMPPENP